MYGYVGWALHRTVNYLVQTKWKEHPLKKRGLFAIHTKVLICVNGSPGNPWTLILNFIWYSNCNWGRKHFLEVRKGKGIYLTMATGQIKTFAGVPSPGSVQEGGRICKPEPSLVSSEMGFGESKYSYALHHLSLCYCFCRSVLLPKIDLLPCHNLYLYKIRKLSPNTHLHFECIHINVLTLYPGLCMPETTTSNWNQYFALRTAFKPFWP